MRVTYVLPTLEVGGQERLVLSLAREMPAHGVTPHVVGLMGGGPLERDLAQAGVPYSVLTPSHVVPGYPAALLTHLGTHGSDLLHCHSGSWFPSAIAGRLRRIPVLHTEHGRYPDEPWWTRPADRLAALCTDRIVVVSDRLQADMQARLRLTAPPALVRNGVEIPAEPDGAARMRARESLGLSPSVPVVGTVGRLVPAKDHALLLESIARLAGSFPALQCVIVGEGPLRADLAARARSLGLEQQVDLPGERRDAAEIVAGFDVFALSSSTEGTPLAVLEAMAMGTPVVATDVGGLRDLLGGGQGGVLVPPGDPVALADAIRGLLVDPVAATRLGTAGRARVASSYSARACAERYVELYRTLTIA